jgi:hypothetical protein
LLGTVSIAFFLNNNIEKFLIISISDMVLTFLLVAVFVLFRIKEKNTIKKYLGEHRISFNGNIRLQDKDVFPATVHLYDNGIMIAEKGNELIPFIYKENTGVIADKESITFHLEELGKVELLPQ